MEPGLPDLRSITPTLCALLGIDPPALATSPAHGAVLEEWQRQAGARPLQRMLIFAPDALGRWLLEKHAGDLLDTVRAYAPVQISLRSVVPPVTPVCFSSIFTGAAPEQHGITRYERPLQRTDSFFDALVRAGRSCAITAVVDCSMDIIFRERAISYFTEPDDASVEQRTLELLRSGEHQVLVAYQQEHDEWLHKTEAQSPQCLAALRSHIDSFSRLAAQAAQSWAGLNWGICFIPDHGSHIDPQSGLGTHGEDIPEDMNLWHFWGIHSG
ncbi:alkaline phosphatase family protein [bacterium]|nr:alkaline phosphatase family protein [bacterium]